MQAVLLAAKGTGARLIGPSSNVTDEAGNVHFNLMFDQGASGRYMLLFGSSATFAFGGIADVVDALRTSAISIAEQVMQANPNPNPTPNPNPNPHPNRRAGDAGQP